MKKKGFTLVELLAVIAILAILVIIALPNVMGMFNNAKKSSFETEVKEILKGAQQQWMMDSVSGTAQAVTVYGVGTKKVVSTDPDAKALTSVDIRSGLSYYVKMNGTGKIIAAAFSDGTYAWVKTGTDIKGEDVKNVATIANDNENTDTFGQSKHTANNSPATTYLNK